MAYRVAIVRLEAPFETLHPGYMFGAMQHEGNLGFRDGDAEYEAPTDQVVLHRVVEAIYKSAEEEKEIRL